jgi:glycosyltransferase involved in cell wall biosynthesis
LIVRSYYFEYYYHPHDSDLDFRRDLPSDERDTLRSYCRNAMLLLDLENCDAGYAPTCWQRSRFPQAYQRKIKTIFDGVDTTLWRRQANPPRQVRGMSVPPQTRIVTYVSRGFESMRGFDIFLKVAKRIYCQVPDVLFVVVGSDRVSYGGDLRYTGGKSFREFTLAQDDYDLSKFAFTGLVPPAELASLLSLSDLHLYFTVPFVLSWSLFNALACGATVLASDTAPVRELIRPGETGLLADFFDVEDCARQALAVLDEPARYRHLGQAGATLVAERYALDKTLPQMLELYQSVTAAG